MYARSREYVIGLQLQESNPIVALLQENESLLVSNQNVLENSIKFYNTFLDSYFTEIALSHKLHDTMEDTRIDLIKDALLKSLVY
jgi:hypothetical protein